MREPKPFGITIEDIGAYMEEQKIGMFTNRPIRAVGMSFFDALKSEDANFIRKGLISKNAMEELMKMQLP